MVNEKEMERYQQQWNDCQQFIRGNVDPHVYDVWFSQLACESYDEERNAVVLTVPSHYVYEYIEELHVPLMNRALSAAFKPGVRLSYRIRKEQAAPAVGWSDAQKIPQLSISNAMERLQKGLKHYLGDSVKWIPAYDQVVEWLSDNKGRGLLCMGASGLGKTLICEKILPVLFGKKVKVVTAQEMNAGIDELLKEKCIIIDDLGKEPVEYKRYGNARKPFFELCDAAEKRGILLVITTNLSTTPVPGNPLYPMSIEDRYGKDVISRLRSIVHVIEFKGKDMRKSS